MQGRHRESERLCRQVIADAEAAGELHALAKALIVLDVNLLETGRPDEATHMLRALRVYEDLGDRPRIADTLNNLGGVAFLKSRWPEAADSFIRAADAAAMAGDLATAALAQYNLGELRVYQGRLQDAEALLVPAIRTLESYGLVITAAQAKMQLGRAQALQGNVSAGVELLEAAIDTVDAAHVLVLSIEARTHLAELRTCAEQFVHARAGIDEARGLARDLGDVPVTVALDRVAATLAATTGDRDAEVQLAHALERARAHRLQYDTLLLLEIRRRLGSEGAVTEAAEIERAELVAELGVVQFVTLGTIPSSDT